MKDIFITSTLHHPWNVAFNPELCAALEQRGFSCHLPQRDTNQAGTADEKCEQNLAGVREAGVILAVALNASPNLGGEVGYAYGISKPIVFLTDQQHDVPLMLKGMARSVLVVDSCETIDAYIDELSKLLR